jgi:hypothetical protein
MDIENKQTKKRKEKSNDEEQRERELYDTYS